jgi:hypothetical protein
MIRRPARLLIDGRRRWLSIGLVDEVAELVAAGDTERGAGAVQVEGDGSGGQEQRVGDLSVGQATACQDHDLALLGGQRLCRCH